MTTTCWLQSTTWALKHSRLCDTLKVSADKCAHAKCERCWYFYPSVGQNAEKPDLCQRCSSVVTD
ncbi:MAG: zinc finger domain-containing protein [Planctomycetota bacterium]